MQLSTLTASSSAFTALIWWLVPLAGVLGALGYILWVSQFKKKFEKGTSRSVNQFERFQNSFRDDSSRNSRTLDKDRNPDKNQNHRENDFQGS
jgi:hypothetical protein